MTKLIPIDPVEVRQPAVLTSRAIPINAYVSDPGVEAARYGSASLARMYRDMLLIREFETLLDRLKKEGAYAGIEYNHRGPAHLSIGQEAAAVGLCYHLTPDDFIFGSHRSHGEILAKSFSAIAKLSGAELVEIMKSYMGGATLRAVEIFTRSGDIADLAV